jgi:hypothetical protein
VDQEGSGDDSKGSPASITPEVEDASPSETNAS